MYPYIPDAAREKDAVTGREDNHQFPRTDGLAEADRLP